MGAFLRKNFATGLLNVALTDSATSMVMDSNSLPTTTGSMRLVIWDDINFSNPGDDANCEIVTAVYASTNTYTITRAQEGTTAVAHSEGARVSLHLTAGVSENDLSILGTIGISETNLAAGKLLKVVDIGASVLQLQYVTEGGTNTQIPYSNGSAFVYSNGLTFNGTKLTVTALGLSGSYPFNIDTDMSNSLTITRTADDVNSFITLLPNKLDGGDSVAIRIIGKAWTTGPVYGIAGVNTNDERLVLRYAAGGAKVEICSIITGAGTVLPLHIFTGARTSQLVLSATADEVIMSGAVIAQGAIRTNTGFNCDGNAGDTDDVAVAKVGGGTRTLSFYGGIYIGYVDS